MSVIDCIIFVHVIQLKKKSPNKKSCHNILINGFKGLMLQGEKKKKT